MIRADVLGVEQKFEFGTGRIRSFVLLDVGGKTVHAEVEDLDEVQTLIDAGMSNGKLQAQEGVALDSSSAHQSVTAKHAAENVLHSDDVVVWSSLSDESLPLKYKRAFEALGVPDRLPVSKIDELAHSIDVEFTDENWAEVESILSETAPPNPDVDIGDAGLVPADKVASPEPPPKSDQSGLGEIQWASGAPIVAQSRPAKTVPKDEMGYPVVSTRAVDPSSVRHSSSVTDEDGVGQF